MSRKASEAKRRDGHVCRKCGCPGSSSDLHAHHIHPNWAGGEDSLDNLVTLCAHCHRYAPELSDKGRCHNAIESFLMTGVRPEIDFAMFGAEIVDQYEDFDPPEVAPIWRTVADLFRDSEEEIEIKSCGHYWLLLHDVARPDEKIVLSNRPK